MRKRFGPFRPDPTWQRLGLQNSALHQAGAGNSSRARLGLSSTLSGSRQSLLIGEKSGCFSLLSALFALKIKFVSSSFLALKTAKCCICNKSLSSFPLFSIFFVFSAALRRLRTQNFALPLPFEDGWPRRAGPAHAGKVCRHFSRHCEIRTGSKGRRWICYPH
jgi:hypothetical protein